MHSSDVWFKKLEVFEEGFYWGWGKFWRIKILRILEKTIELQCRQK